MENQRNLIWAVVLMGLLLIGWDQGVRYFYPQANKPKPVASAPANADAAPAKPTREGGLQAPADVALEAQDLKAALASPQRVAIDAPGLKGSINLVGGVIDDLTLVRHREALDKSSAPVRIFSPAGTPAQHFAQLGWLGENGLAAPNGQTVFTAQGGKLTPATPVTLSWTNPTGQTFSIRYAIDQNYLITATQSVANAGGAPVTVKPFAFVNRTDKTASLDTWQVHSGPIGAFDGSVNFATNYKDVAATGQVTPAGTPNWIGFTDIYWLSTLVPAEGSKAKADFRALGNGVFRADLVWPQTQVAPGQTQSQQVRLFAGAKENSVLESYEKQGVTNLSLSIDWGWFRWFEKPIFWLLDSLFRAVKNFGVAIILLTLIVRGIMFPVAQRQFASMAAMKAIQPKMKAIQERYKDDKQKQQQEVMALYKQEGVNPLAGCLPIFLQIPVFFALYKVLVLTIEMRHQPFGLWIHDLSSPDPLHVLNLFGLLPFTPPSFLAIGPLAILLGITMWAQFKLQPSAMDPAQQQVMSIMPWMMMFVMAPFAAGLLIYWITSNLLTIGQQRYLYARHPQLKAQADKDQQNIDRSVARDKKAVPPPANKPKRR
ncbi:membrane protein insertase YidC [Novosphingobium cyanobacteriorum]|uniref:Membrane protein insertase YidC n=1 Tax=Novosphingobium cyanobacteriorum TaxID=3024215 RepID=A0ABT6CDF4_9SPHN|nr:membrane protein insertase YidC [Novosphingobium cyanobacteriorum]MDF8331959.1 membrane protein insertase YidC [Novosphingobium cyanobacteriorum]